MESVKKNWNQYAPSWETALGAGGVVAGAAVGVANRFGGAFSLINWIGQEEVKLCPLALSVMVPLAAKISYDSWHSKAVQKNMTKEQVLAAGILSGLGYFGLLKSMLITVCQPIAFLVPNPSGHFLTKILASAITVSVAKTMSENSSPTEKKVLAAWMSLNFIKDGVLLCNTLAGYHHTIPEAITGSIVGLMGVAGGYYLASIAQSKSSCSSSAGIEIKGEGPNSYRMIYGKENALVDIDSGQILDGTLSPNIKIVAIQWASAYRKELQEQPENSLFLVKKKESPLPT